MKRDNLVSTFTTNAKAVSMVVQKITTLAEAFDYALNLCETQKACQLLVSGCNEALSDAAIELCERKTQKVIAAPALPHSQWETFKTKCHQRGIELISNKLRDHLAGIDLGFTIADFGIAETGTLVLDCANENVRLATMISEIHLAVLPLSRLKAGVDELTTTLIQRMSEAPSYLAFITGASRTADIERVLTLGVHGPLEVHVLLWEDD